MRALLARRDADLGAGAQSVGWKIGFNTPAIQEHFGLAQPVVGYLTDAGLTANGATVPLAGWAAPAVEVEVAIRVGPDLGVAGLAPALELVDLGMPSMTSRWSSPATSVSEVWCSARRSPASIPGPSSPR
jgi:2-keto-4-pentenoate hydratase